MPPVQPPEPPLACPVCGEDLHRRDAVFACANGHAFDVAREGYVNLLPAQHKSRGIEGDVAEMLHARRRFLDTGFYAPLRDALTAEAAFALAAHEGVPPVALEVGCGEGYYVGGMAEALPAGARLLGTDLSKAAVRLAAKRYAGPLFFVSDVHRRIYVRDASVGVLLDVFAPRNPAEFARIVAPGGSAIVAIPADAHLAELRAALGLLDVEPEKERRVAERLAEGFALVERRTLEYPLQLSAEAVADLVHMGPSHWHREGPEAFEACETRASFVLLRFERTVA